jgi:hypothetical protein
MIIVRSFDYFSAIVPLVVKQGDRVIGSINSFHSEKKISLEKQTELEIRLQFFKTKCVVNDNSVIVVSQPAILRKLFILSIVSAGILFLISSKNDVIYLALSFFPALYLLTIAYYCIFKRKQFLKITEVSN